MTEERNQMLNGMAIAAGIVMYSYGDELSAKAILNAAGLRTVGDLRAAGVQTYDIRLLVPVLRDFRSETKLRERRTPKLRSKVRTKRHARLA